VKSFSEKFTSEHAPYVAAEHHMAYLPGLVEKALSEAGKEISEMKAIAVTIGPG